MNNKSTPAQKELPIQSYNRILQIFSQKGWPVDSDMDEAYFDKFCELLKELSMDEQEMLLTLTEDFVWIQEMEYIKYFRKAFDSFIRSLPPDQPRTIVLAPLLPEADFGNSKSSVTLIYLIKCVKKKLDVLFPLHKINMMDNPAKFDPSQYPEDALFCLVDDFIGSGETAVSAVKYYLDSEDHPIPKQQLVVLGLVVLQQGIDLLRNDEIQVFAAVVMDKAISCRTDGNVERYRELMQGIETRIKVRKSFTFGYAHSEGLVRMARTPNNTFPIYWQIARNPNAPFPR